MISFLVNLPSWFALSYFVWRVLDIRKSYWLTLLLNGIWFIPTQSFNYFADASGSTLWIVVAMSVQIVSMLLAIKLISGKSWWHSVLCVVLQFACVLIGSESGRLINTLLEVLPTVSQMDPVLRGVLFTLLRVLLQCALLVWSAEIICMFLKRHPNNIRWRSFAAMLTVQIVSCLLIALLADSLELKKNMPTMLLFSGYVVLLCGADVHMLRMFGETVKSSELERRLLLQEQQMTLQREQYQMIGEQIIELRQMRHDYSNTLGTIRQLITDGNMQKADALAEATGQRLKGSIGRYTGIPVVDALLYRKLLQAEHAHIAVDMCFALPEESGIDDRDLLSIYANLLDNALEYCETLPEGTERRIDISAVTQGQIVALRFQNTYLLKTPPSLDGMHSTKKDPSLHGIGLQIVQTAVARYKGTLSAAVEDGMLSFTVMLSAREKPE